jgi:cytoskeletal protein CcmA (bactofilin family)
MSKWNPMSVRATQSADISTLLSKDTEIRGTLKAQGPIRVDGTVIGDVIATKTVTIGATGVVEGSISGEDIMVAGKVKGTLTARGRIALEGTAQLEGDIQTSRLSIAEGAVFKGLSNMGVAVRAGVRTGESKDENVPQPAQRERIAAA